MLIQWKLIRQTLKNNYQNLSKLSQIWFKLTRYDLNDVFNVNGINEIS